MVGILQFKSVLRNFSAPQKKVILIRTTYDVAGRRGGEGLQKIVKRALVSDQKMLHNTSTVLKYNNTRDVYLYPNNTRDVYLYIYSVSAYMG